MIKKNKIEQIKDLFRNSNPGIRKFYIELARIKDLLVNKKMSYLYCKYRSEKVYHYGKENDGKIVYVISINAPTSGIAPVIIYLLGQFEYAEKKGYIPVVDFSGNYMELWTGGGEN